MSDEHVPLTPEEKAALWQAFLRDLPKPTPDEGPDQPVEETASVSLEALAEIFYRLHWQGRMDAYPRTVLDDGDWTKLRKANRNYWRAEAKRFVIRQPLRTFLCEEER